MAVTTLAIANNRILSRSYLTAQVSSVALDASVSEQFILPTAPVFGALLIESIIMRIATLSGAYVAPAPAFDGFSLKILSADATTTVDIIGAERFVHVGTASARPNLETFLQLYRPVLMRQNEQILAQAPVIAGGGVTANVSCLVRGQRLVAG